MGGLTIQYAKVPETKRNSPLRIQRTKSSRPIKTSADRILFLQRTIGNQAVQRLTKSGTLQTKLKIGQPGDKYEQEADRLADQVMRMTEPGVQRQVEPEEEEEEILQTKPLVDQITPLVQVQRQEETEEEEEEMLQAKPLAEEITPFVQRQVEPEEEEEPIQAQLSDGAQLQRQEEEEKELQAKSKVGTTLTVTPSIESRINSLKGGGQPLDPATRNFFEPRFGHNFSQVRVHTDSQASESAKSINSRAYTLGNDIVFGSPGYSPRSGAGQRLLAHELTHVVQQSSKIQPNVQRFRVLNVANVSSLKIGEWRSKRGPPYTNWASLQKKMTSRVKIFNSWIKIYGNRHASFALMNRLLQRWPSLKELLGNARFIPATGALPANRAMQAARTDELADLVAVDKLGTGAKFVKGEILNFIKALDAYTNSRATLHKEGTEYHRIDNLFTARDVKTLVAAITQRGVGWTAADVKAVVSQETGDLTDTSVVGIAPKTQGIVTGRARSAYHRRTYIGLGQHNSAARADAIRWAVGKGVKIPTIPDPRRTPTEAIKLTAAYLGWLADRMNNGLPDPTPVKGEFKKFVFAAYNWGHGNVLHKTKATSRGAGAYTWATVAPKMRSQTKNYVDEIVSRLS